MNYFVSKAAAERYSKGRPYFHVETVARLKRYLRVDDKLERALDVACGTGLSTQALLDVATDVYGTDPSEEMLNFALQCDKIHYTTALAEIQPFPNNFFDLITVSSGVHWFDIDKFLLEVHRLLKDGAWLVLYENYFVGKMIGVEKFTDWFWNVYLKKFPSPPRNNEYPWTDENLAPKKFHFDSEQRFDNTVEFNKRQLALYFTTQSNVIAAVEKKETNFDEVEHWLEDQLSSFFDGDSSRSILYGNWIKFIQRLADQRCEGPPSP